MTKKRFIILLIITLFVGIAVELGAHYTLQFYQLSSRFEDGFEVSLNDQAIGICKQDDYVRFIELHVGRKLTSEDVITLTAKLPELGVIPAPTIYLKSTYTAFAVLLDGEVYKSYNMTEAMNGSFVGKEQHLISLPKNYNGMTVTLRLYPTMDHEKILVSELIFGDYEDLEQYVVHKYFSLLHTGSAMMVLGILMLVIATTFSFFVRGMRTHIITSALFIDMGVILHMYFNCNFLYMDGSIGQEALFYAFMFLFPLMMALDHTIAHTRKDKAHMAASFFTVAYATVRIILHITNTTHMNRLYVLHIIPYAVAIFFMIRSIRKLKKADELTETASMQYWGIFMCTGLMTVGWILSKIPSTYLPITEDLWTDIYIMCFTIGGMLLLFTNMVTFVSISANAFSTKEEYNMLTRVAFEDILTGLQNRAALERSLNTLTATATDYCIISLDMNDLKKTNDLYGHAAGDTLLANFAKALSETFKNEVACGRMGGDEFVVLSRIVEPHVINQLLTDLDKRLEKMNKSSTDHLHYSCAYGYAFRHEKDSPHTTYLLADQRMYVHKQKIKAKDAKKTAEEAIKEEVEA